MEKSDIGTVLVIKIDKDGNDIAGSEQLIQSSQWSNLVKYKNLRWKKIIKQVKAKQDESSND